MARSNFLTTCQWTVSSSCADPVRFARCRAGTAKVFGSSCLPANPYCIGDAATLKSRTGQGQHWIHPHHAALIIACQGSSGGDSQISSNAQGSSDAPHGKVLIVESPEKARRIRQWLGKSHYVIASKGHIRRLSNPGDAVSADTMRWQMEEHAEEVIEGIGKALQHADELVLATDRDREGEGIAWHVQEVLQQRGLIQGKQVSRMTFTEVSESAILDALSKRGSLDQGQVNAYQTRSSYDQKLGIELSQLLQQKLPNVGARSAGRVKVPALMLLADRDRSRSSRDVQMQHVPQVLLQTASGDAITAYLKPGKHGQAVQGFATQHEAEQAMQNISKSAYKVATKQSEKVAVEPQAPFNFVDLLCAAEEQLGMSQQNVQNVASGLFYGMEHVYEEEDHDDAREGQLTYTRSDSHHIADKPLQEIRVQIESDFGKAYVPAEPRRYEPVQAERVEGAHEAIRPVDISVTAEQLRGFDRQEMQLYTRVRAQTLASQMKDAQLHKITLELTPDDPAAPELVAYSWELKFDGFMHAHTQDSKEQYQAIWLERCAAHLAMPWASNRDFPAASMLKKGSHLSYDKSEISTVSGSPPVPYSGALLMKALQKSGIGRPSTYAGLPDELQAFGYVGHVAHKRQTKGHDIQMLPRGYVVLACMKRFFPHFADLELTAQLEADLEGVAAGQVTREAVLSKAWSKLHADIQAAKALSSGEFWRAILDEVEPDTHLVTEQLLCEVCQKGQLKLCATPAAASGVCIQCDHCQQLSVIQAMERKQKQGQQRTSSLATLEASEDAVYELGPHPVYGEMMTVHNNEMPSVRMRVPPEIEFQRKIAIASLPKGADASRITLADAVRLMERRLARRAIGTDEDGRGIEVGMNDQGGVYLRASMPRSAGQIVNLPQGVDPRHVTLKQAVQILEPNQGSKGRR